MNAFLVFWRSYVVAGRASTPRFHASMLETQPHEFELDKVMYLGVHHFLEHKLIKH